MNWQHLIRAFTLFNENLCTILFTEMLAAPSLLPAGLPNISNVGAACPLNLFTAP